MLTQRAALAKFGCTTLPPWVKTVALTSSSSKLILIALGFLVDQCLDEGDKVLGVKLRGGGGNAAGNIQVADDLDAVDLDDLAGNRAFDIAAALHRQIDEDRTRTHARIHLARHQPWRGTTRNERRGDDDILLGNMVINQRRLLCLIFFRHFLGITTRRLGRLEFLVLNGKELGTERGDLFLDRGTHVRRGNDGTETARRGDRLQAGNTDTHDEHLGGRHRARRRHHHRQRAVIFCRRIDHRLITGKIGLAGKNVHDLRPRDARHEFHGEGRHPRIGQFLDRRIVAVGIEHGDDHRALLVGLELGRARPAHLQNHIGALTYRGLANRCARSFKLTVRNARCNARHPPPQ